MAVFLTIFAGVATFVLGQIALKLLIEPVHEFKKTVAEISHSLIEYANIYSNPEHVPDEKQNEVTRAFRKHSSNLNAKVCLIPKYRLLARVFGLPTEENLAKASRYLIGLSNGFGRLPNQGMVNAYRAQHVSDALGIYVPEHERLPPELEQEFVKG